MRICRWIFELTFKSEKTFHSNVEGEGKEGSSCQKELFCRVAAEISGIFLKRLRRNSERRGEGRKRERKKEGRKETENPRFVLRMLLQSRRREFLQKNSGDFDFFWRKIWKHFIRRKREE